MKVLMLAPGHSINSKRAVKLLLNEGYEIIYLDKLNPFPNMTDNYIFFRFPFITIRGLRFIEMMLSYRIAKVIISFESWINVIFLSFVKKVYNPSLTHIHWADKRIFLCKKAGLRPIILSVWGSDINEKGYLVQKEKGDILESADLIIVNAPEMIKICKELAPNKKFVILHYGINTKIFHSNYNNEIALFKRRYNINDYSKIIVSPRGWRQDYNHYFIFEAFYMLQKMTTNKLLLIFLLMGIETHETKEYYEFIYNEAVELGMIDDIRFIKELSYSKMPLIYTLADLIVNYPERDSFPATILEAGASGCPIVSRFMPTYKNTIFEKNINFVKYNSTIKDLAITMNNSLNQKSQNEMMSRNRFQHEIKKNYDERHFSRKINEIYSLFT
jgi:glycosyltransferase involved in cell wall biosynthesis|tara:strand:- start:2168 stop:3328 length:1161 start_codon:yes stop_codon:yes gene_type:complete